MSNFSTITNSKDYVNYVFNIGTRGVIETTTEIVGMSHTIQNLLGNLAFKTSEYLTSTETLAMGFGIAATAAFAHATQSAIEFQQATASVEAISGKNLIGSEIGAKAMALSNEFGLAIGEMTQGLEALARAGIVANSSIDALMRAGVQMSKFEGTDLEESINSILSTTNLLNPDANPDSEEYAQIVADLNQRIISTSESAPLNAKNIMDTLQHVGGYASATGIDQADLFATIAQLGAKGTKGDIAGTSLRAFISAGQKDTGQRALARIGLDVSDLWNDDGTAMLPISEVKRILDEALVSAGFSAQERLEFYSDFAGYKQANQIMKIDSTEVDEYRAKIDNAMTLTDKMNIILGTVQGNWAQIWNTVSNYMTKVGSTLLPIINAILIPIKYIVKAIDAIPFSNVIGAFALGSIAIRGISTAFNALVPTISSFILKFATLDTKGFTLKGYFEDIQKSLAQSKDILKHINDKEYMKNIMEERDTASTDKELDRRLEREAIDAYYRQQYGRITDENGQIALDSMGREIWRWDTLTASERAYIANAHTPDNDDIRKIIAKRKRDYELNYSQVLFEANERGGFESPPDGWADQTRFFEQRGTTFQNVIAKALQEIEKNIKRLTEEITGSTIFDEGVNFNESNRERNQRKSDHKEVIYNESNRERNRRRREEMPESDSRVRSRNGRKYPKTKKWSKQWVAPTVRNPSFSTDLGRLGSIYDLRNIIPAGFTNTQATYRFSDENDLDVRTGWNVDDTIEAMYKIMQTGMFGDDINLTERYLTGFKKLGLDVNLKNFKVTSKDFGGVVFDNFWIPPNARQWVADNLPPLFEQNIKQFERLYTGYTRGRGTDFGVSWTSQSNIPNGQAIGKTILPSYSTLWEIDEIQDFIAKAQDTHFHELFHYLAHDTKRTELTGLSAKIRNGEYDTTGFFGNDNTYVSLESSQGYSGSYNYHKLGYEIESNLVGKYLNKIFKMPGKNSTDSRINDYVDALSANKAGTYGTDINSKLLNAVYEEINKNPLYFYNMIAPFVENLDYDYVIKTRKGQNSAGYTWAQDSASLENIEQSLENIKIVQEEFRAKRDAIAEGFAVQELLTTNLDVLAEKFWEIIDIEEIGAENLLEIAKEARNRAERTPKNTRKLHAFSGKEIADNFEKLKIVNNISSQEIYEEMLKQEMSDRSEKYSNAMASMVLSPVLNDFEANRLEKFFKDQMRERKDDFLQQYIAEQGLTGTPYDIKKELLTNSTHHKKLTEQNQAIQDEVISLVNQYISIRSGQKKFKSMEEFEELPDELKKLFDWWTDEEIREQIERVDKNGKIIGKLNQLGGDAFQGISFHTTKYYHRDIGGNIIKKPAFDRDGNPLFDKNGNRVMSQYQNSWTLGGYTITQEQLDAFRAKLRKNDSYNDLQDESQILNWFASLDPTEWYGAYLTLSNRNKERIDWVFRDYFTKNTKNITDTGMDNFEYDFINPQEYKMLFKHFGFATTVVPKDIDAFDEVMQTAQELQQIFGDEIDSENEALANILEDKRKYWVANKTESTQNLHKVWRASTFTDMMNQIEEQRNTAVDNYYESLGVANYTNSKKKQERLLEDIWLAYKGKDRIVEYWNKNVKDSGFVDPILEDIMNDIINDEDYEANKELYTDRARELKRSGILEREGRPDIPYKDMKFSGFRVIKQWLEDENGTMNQDRIKELAKYMSLMRDNPLGATIDSQKWDYIKNGDTNRQDWLQYLIENTGEETFNGITKDFMTYIDDNRYKQGAKFKLGGSAKNSIGVGQSGLQFYYNVRDAIIRSYGLDPSDLLNEDVQAIDNKLKEVSLGHFGKYVNVSPIKHRFIENIIKDTMVNLRDMGLNEVDFISDIFAPILENLEDTQQAQQIISLGLQTISANLRDQYQAHQRNMRIDELINKTQGASAGRLHQRMIAGGYGAEARQAEDELFEAQQIRIGAQRYGDMYGQNLVENKAQQEALKNLRRQHENLRSAQEDILSMGRNASESQIPMAILDMEKDDWIANEAQRIFDKAKEAGHGISMEEATTKAEKNWEKGKNSGFGLEQREKRQNLAKQFAGLDTHGINPTYFADMVRMQQGTYDAEDSAIAPWKKTIENINAFMGSVGGFGLPNGSSLFADLVTEAGMNGGKLMMDEEGNFNEYVEDTLKQAEDLRDWTTLWTIAPEIKEREMDKLDGIFTTWKRDKLIDVFGTAERVQRMSDEEIGQYWQNNWVDDLYEWRAQATEKASNRMAEMLTQFNENNNMDEGVEQFKEYMGSIGMVFANASERVGMLHGAMAELSNVFPVLTPLVWGLGTVYSILTGITTALAIATTFLTEAQNEELKSKLSGALGKVLEPLKKTVAGTLGKAMSSIVGFVSGLSLTTVAIIGGVVASILAVVFALKKSAESHDAYVKELTEKQSLLNKESQGAYISYEQNKRLIRRGARDSEQQSYRESMYNLAKTRLESANLKRINNAFKLAEQNGDALWGEYGARTKLQAESWGEALATGGPIGLIAKYLAGDFESKYEEHLGYTGGIRKIREETLKRDFFHTTDAMRQASAYYDANQVAFNTLEQYKTELAELYDIESKYVKRTGDVESARQNQRFQKALLETSEKTGLTQEQILSYLNWLQIEKNVDTATQAMQATADQIVANAEKQAFAIEFGQDMDDVLGLNGVEAQQKAMIQAQADMIKMEAEDKLWWKAFWAELSAVFWAVMSPLTTLVNFLQYIYLGVNYIAQILAHGWWSDEAKQAGNALDRKGKDLQSSMGDLFGVGRAGRKARVYSGAFNEMVNADLYGVGESAVSPYDRNNFGTDGSSTGTMSSSGISSRYRSSMGNATQMTSKRNTDEVFANRLREEQKAGIFDIFDLLKHWKENPQGSGGNLLGDAFGFILGLTPIGPAFDIANSLGSIFSSEEDRQKAKDALKATKEAVDKAKAGEKGAVIIKNININTDDDPEKIKTALMNMIIELQEQIQPRTVSRTVGEQSNSNNADNSDNTPDQSGNTNPTN